jgi:tetratricopeptide (TPR) repeat protein
MQKVGVILDTYVSQLKSNEATPDKSLLQQAEEILTKRMERQGLTREVVQFGIRLYHLWGDWDTCIQLLARYLEQPHSIDDEAWARWHLTDFLAMQRRYTEAVSTHKEYLAWARRALPTDRLLWVMSDGTQALSWIQLDLQDEWLQIFDDVMAGVTPSAENRLDRFYYLRTAGQLLINFGHNDANLRADDALQIAARIRDLADEEPSWDRSFDIKVQSCLLELDIYAVQRNIEQVRRLGIAVMAALEGRLQGFPSMVDAERERMGVLYDNGASPLYRARQYDLAIPLFRRSIELGSPSPHARIWLAASLWAAAGDRQEILSLLKEAAYRWHSPRRLWDFISSVPEFHDVADTIDFKQAASIMEINRKRAST